MAEISERIALEGWDDIRRRLLGLPENIIRKILRASMRQAANIVRDQAKANCPERTGALRDSIRTVERRGGRDWVYFNVVAGGDFTPSKQERYGTKSAYWALWVEKGHWINTGKALGGTGKDAQRQRRIAAGQTGFVAPRPYMKPALEQTAQLAIDWVGTGISDRLPECIE